MGASAINSAPSRLTARRRAGGLERDVVRCLVAAGRPLTAAEAQSELGGGLALTTVATTLTRLRTKGALRRIRAGRGYAYAVVGDPDTVTAAITARTMRRLLDAGGERTGVLARFVAVLDPADGQVLARLLAQKTVHEPALW